MNNPRLNTKASNRDVWPGSFAKAVGGFIKPLVLLWGIIATMSASQVHAAEPMLEFETEQEAALYLQLTKDHRCLKCQNQNLADSAAGIAQDLKREIYQRVRRGETAEQISAYLVARYGDFVLYKPPFKATTYVLWIGPFILLLLALWYARRITKQSGAESNTPDQESLARARALLDE